jgi:nucleotide-binding universal stress UspA family protein
MERFKNILVVFNSKTDNQALFDQVVNLVQRNRAAITVADFIEEAPPSLEKQGVMELTREAQKAIFPIIEELPNDISITPETKSGGKDLSSGTNAIMESTIEIQEWIKQEEQRRLEQFISALQKVGIYPTSKTIVGIPFIEIIREVLLQHHDLVMITAEGSGSFKETLFGNTTMHLMRKCPCPVWAIKPGQPKKTNRILAAVDLSSDDKERVALTKTIMELATSLSRLWHSELLIIHAWSLYGESLLRGRGGVSNETINELLRETQDAHRQWLIELLQQYPLDDLKPEVFLLKGEAGTLITELVQAKAIDLIVMGTVSRAGVSGLLIGNTAEKVLHQVDCSVLTVKPEGFISPVKPDQR